MVYSDVVKNNMILPKKEKYTKKDFKKLVGAGYTQLQARFIIICSALFHYEYESAEHLPKYFYSENFTLKCKYNNVL